MSQLIRYGAHALAGFLPVPGATQAISYRGKGGGFTDADTTLAFDFAKNKDLIDEINGLALTFTRTTLGWYYDAAGVLTQAAIDEARFDHNPDTLESLGLTIESARTNDFLNSTVPVTQDITLAASTYTVSMRGAGSITLSGANTGVATQAVPLVVAASAGATTFTLAGGVTFAQVEVGLFPTSPIVTAGVAVLRAQDTCFTLDTTWYLQLGPSTVFSKQSLYDSTISNGTPYHFSDASIFEQIRALTVATPLWRFTSVSSVGSDSIMDTASGAVNNIPSKLAGAIATNDAVIYFDGVQGATDIDVGQVGGITRLDVGQRNNGTAQLNGHMQQLAYAPVRKDNAFLQAVTTP